MKEFALRHPWLTALIIVPVTVGGVVRLVHAARGTPGDLETALRAAQAEAEVERLRAEAKQAKAAAEGKPLTGRFS